MDEIALFFNVMDDIIDILTKSSKNSAHGGYKI